MIEQTVVNRRYRVDRLVGQGGMAVVYRGHDLLLGRDVAIKALRPQFAADRAFRVRFEREAQAAAGFAHPNIIDIYDVGEEAGTPYIVMAFVNGQTLKEIIAAEAPFHPDDVAALLEQVSAALDYAHERGYVHRDVKPQNILVDERGLARVVDFGIAKGLADADLTEVGTGLGTVHYLSPEQASGLMATPASDVYSVGVVAFEMLTKRLPFEADSPVGVAMRHVHDAPPRPSDLGPRVPPAVDAIVLQALAKDPTRRFPSAGEFARAMAEWRHWPTGEGGGPAPALAGDGSKVPTRTDRADDTFPRAVKSTSTSRESIRPATGPSTAPRRLRGSAHQPAAGGDELGCATWVVGTVLLVGLIGLIWVGFRLSPRLAELGGGDEAPTEAANPMRPTITAGLPVPVSDDAGPTGQTAAERAPAIEPVADGLVVVPDLTGLTVADATESVNERGLLLAQSGEVSSEEVPAGTVAEQDPPANAEVRQGETVDVKLSRGSERIDLRALQLVGRSADEAEALLVEHGLVVEREEVPSVDVPPGLVAGTDPADRARPGETATLLVSVGDRVRIPEEIQGQPIDQVERQLEALGLRVGDRYPVDRATIEGFGLDLASAAIEDRDVVGVQGAEVTFNAWVPPGTEVDLVYYDRGLDRR